MALVAVRCLLRRFEHKEKDVIPPETRWEYEQVENISYMYSLCAYAIILSTRWQGFDSVVGLPHLSCRLPHTQCDSPLSRGLLDVITTGDEKMIKTLDYLLKTVT